MTGPDYPMLTIPGYDLYQAAVLATFVVDALARHRRATENGSRADSRNAARDVHAGRLALSRVTNEPQTAAGPLPRPLDASTHATANDLLAQQESRRVQVVSLAPAGRTTWAVVGQIPSVGPVGAEVGDPHLAEALRRHLLVAPTAELTGWAVTPTSLILDTSYWRTVDDTAVIDSLDPDNAQHRYIAAALRGTSKELDHAIDIRFSHSPRPRYSTAPPASGRNTAGFPVAAQAFPQNCPPGETANGASSATGTRAGAQARPSPVPRPRPQPNPKI